MIQAINIDDPVEYIAKCDRDSNTPTVWELKQLSIQEENFISGMALKATRGKGQEEKMIEYSYNALHIGLIGAQNFLLKGGKTAIFERDATKHDVVSGVKPWTDKTLSQIPKRIRDELATYIITKEELTEPEAKNS